MKRDCWDKEFRTMVTFGMSITAGGWSSCRERRWTNLLAGMIGDYQRMPVQLVNVGVGANLISPRSPGYEYSQKPSASERLEEHVLSNTANGAPVVPDLLIMAFGLTITNTSFQFFRNPESKTQIALLLFFSFGFVTFL